MLQHGRQALPRALVSLRHFSAQPAADALGSGVPERAGGASSQASDFVPRVANLSATRSVLRLAGPDLLTFLQVYTGSTSVLLRIAMHGIVACSTLLQRCILELVTCLQGLVTNDVAALEDPQARPMYACILNAQGRFLHDLFLHRQPGGPGIR